MVAATKAKGDPKSGFWSLSNEQQTPTVGKAGAAAEPKTKKKKPIKKIKRIPIGTASASVNDQIDITSVQSEIGTKGTRMKIGANSKGSIVNNVNDKTIKKHPPRKTSLERKLEKLESKTGNDKNNNNTGRSSASTSGIEMTSGKVNNKNKKKLRASLSDSSASGSAAASLSPSASGSSTSHDSITKKSKIKKKVEKSRSQSPVKSKALMAMSKTTNEDDDTTSSKRTKPKKHHSKVLAAADAANNSSGSSVKAKKLAAIQKKRSVSASPSPRGRRRPSLSSSASPSSSRMNIAPARSVRPSLKAAKVTTSSSDIRKPNSIVAAGVNTVNNGKNNSSRVLLTPRRGSVGGGGNGGGNGGMMKIQRAASNPIIVGNTSSRLLNSSFSTQQRSPSLKRLPSNSSIVSSKSANTSSGDNNRMKSNSITNTPRTSPLARPSSVKGKLKKSNSSDDVLESMTMSDLSESTTSNVSPETESTNAGEENFNVTGRRGLQRNSSDPTFLLNRSLSGNRLSLLTSGVGGSSFVGGKPLQKISENKVYRRPNNNASTNANASANAKSSSPTSDTEGGNQINEHDTDGSERATRKKSKASKRSKSPRRDLKTNTRRGHKRSESTPVHNDSDKDVSDPMNNGKRPMIERSKSDDVSLMVESMHRKDMTGDTTGLVRSKSGDLPTPPQGILRSSSHHGPGRPSMKRENSRVSIAIPVGFDQSVEIIKDDINDYDEDIEEVSINFEPERNPKKKSEKADGNSSSMQPKPRPTLKRGLSVGSMNFSSHSLKSMRSQLSVDKEPFENDPRWKAVLRWLRILPPHKNENELKRRIRVLTWVVLFLDFLAAMVAVTTYKGATTCCGSPIFSVIIDINWDTCFRVITAMYIVLIFAEIIPVVRQGLPFNVLNPLLGFAITFAMFFDDSVAEALAMWIIEAMAVFFEFIVYRTRCRIYNEAAERIEKASKDLENIKKSQRLIVQSMHGASMHGSKHVDKLALTGETGNDSDDDDDSFSGGSFAGNDSNNSLDDWDKEADHSLATKATVTLDQSLASQQSKVGSLPSQPSHRGSLISQPSKRGSLAYQPSKRGQLATHPSDRRSLMNIQTPSSRQSSRSPPVPLELSKQPSFVSNAVEGPSKKRRNYDRSQSSGGISFDQDIFARGISSHSSGGGSMIASSAHSYHLPGEIRQNRLLRERRLLREHQKKDQVELRLQLLSTFFGVGLAIISLVLIITIASTGGLCVADGAARIFATDQLAKCNKCSDTSDVCEVCNDWGNADGQNQCYFPYY